MNVKKNALPTLRLCRELSALKKKNSVFCWKISEKRLKLIFHQFTRLGLQVSGLCYFVQPKDNEKCCMD